MRFNELFEEKVYEQSNASALAKSLIGKVSDPDAIKKATDYLVGLANQIIKAKDKQVDQQQQSREEPTPLAQQSQEQPKTVEPAEPAKESLGEAIDTNKKVALDAIEAIAAAGDENALNQVIAFLKGAELKELAGAAIQNNISQGIKGNLDQKLSDIVAGTNTSFEDKEKFLQDMASAKGFFDGSVLIQQPTGNLYQVFDKVPVLNQIYRKLALELRGAMGYGPDQGPGEFLLALTGQGVDLADKSDLILVDGQGVEVKADGTAVSAKTGKKSRSGGRLYSTSGYGTASTARVGMFKAMVDNGVPAEVMKQYGWPVRDKGVKYPAGGLNFNEKGVQNLNSLFSQYMDRAGVQEVMRAMVNGLYTELPEGMSDKFINTVNQDGTIDYKTMMTELIVLGHLYYKAQEGHDYIMVLNTNTGDYVMMGDEAQTRKLLQQGVVRPNSGMDFFDDRSKGTPQLLTNI
jgi:hypothetical protein